MPAVVRDGRDGRGPGSGHREAFRAVRGAGGRERAGGGGHLPAPARRAPARSARPLLPAGAGTGRRGDHRRADPRRRGHGVLVQRAGASGRQGVGSRASPPRDARCARRTFRTACCSRIGSLSRSRRGGRARGPGSCPWTSTVSRRSTTPSGIMSATACSIALGDRVTSACVRATRSRGSRGRVPGRLRGHRRPRARGAGRGPAARRAAGAVRARAQQHRRQRQHRCGGVRGPQRACRGPASARGQRALRSQAPRRRPLSERDQAGAPSDRPADQLERDLRSAIDNDELRLEFQPIVDLTTGRASHVEALVRWAHPQLGDIAAPAIVASAERTGLVRDLGAG